MFVSVKYPKTALPNLTEVANLLDVAQNGEESDSVLILQSVIERTLYNRLKNLLQFSTPTIRRRLFSDDGPLATFTTKLDIVCSLENITPDVADDARIIAKIRNHFAHRVEIVDFNTAEICDLCSKLKCKLANLNDYLSGPKMEMEETLDPPHEFVFLDVDGRIIFQLSTPKFPNKTKARFYESCIVVWLSFVNWSILD